MIPDLVIGEWVGTDGAFEYAYTALGLIARPAISSVSPGSVIVRLSFRSHRLLDSSPMYSIGMVRGTLDAIASPQHQDSSFVPSRSSCYSQHPSCRGDGLRGRPTKLSGSTMTGIRS